jgi:putative acetyltransferase
MAFPSLYNSKIMGQMLRTDSSNTDFITLVALLDIDLAARDGEENTFYAQFNGISVLEHCVVYYENNIPLGCGALKAFDDTNMESKRIYVSVSSQGKGIASLLLKNWKSGPPNWVILLAF